MTDHAHTIREPLTENERRIALAAFAAGGKDSRKWGNLVLDALDALSADLAAAVREAEGSQRDADKWATIAAGNWSSQAVEAMREATAALDAVTARAEAAERDLAAAGDALRAASARLGELTQPPWNELTPLVAEVRDDIRAALKKSEGTA